MPRKKSEDTQKRSLVANGFYSDLSKKDCLYAVLIRSPAATGKIKSVTAKNLDEGCRLFTAQDIPGQKIMETNGTKSKIFGYGSVSYTGEPLAILTGPSLKIVKENAEKISVNFDVASLEAAVQQVIDKKRPVIDLHNTSKVSELNDFVEKLNDLPSLDTVLDKTHSEENTNKIVAVREIKTGLYENLALADADSALFSNLDEIIEESWSQKIINPDWHETDGAFCYVEGEKIHVYVPTKWTWHLQNALVKALNLPSEKIFIHKTKTSGIYSNGLCRTNQIAVQVAIASYLTRKPVKLVLTQKEQKKYMAPGVNTKIFYRAAVSADGKIKALKAKIDMDVGAENPFAREITDRIAIAATNFYKIPNLHIFANTHISKNPPTTIHIKSVDSQVFFAIESMLHKISQKTGIFPDELRLLNSAVNKKENIPILIEPPQMEDTISDATKNSDFGRKYASYQMEAIDRTEKDSRPFFAMPLRGIGMASGYNISGYCGESNFSYNSKMEVTLTTEDKVIIHAIKPSDSVQEIWKKNACEILQLPPQNISIDSDFDVNELPENPEDIFSSIGIINEIVRRCCNDIQRKRFHQPLPITTKRSLSNVIKKNWNNKTFSGQPFHSTASATTVVEIELDTYTFSEKIKGIWISVCCGELLDEAAALRTIRLEVQQEPQMLVKGKGVSYSNLHVNFVKSDKKSSQIGELVHNTLPAAFSSALSLALATQITELPVTENQLYNLVKKRNSKNLNPDKKETNLKQNENSGGNS